jgi:endonuclease VIII-like 1
MPELAELRLTSDFVNTFSSGRIYSRVEKNPSHKGKDIQIPFKKFTITSQSRGKELLLSLKDTESDNYLNLLMTMGMSGLFWYSDSTTVSKHAHLKFYDTYNDRVLSFVDVRRFGKWKFSESWSKNRGPDPTSEFDKFRQNIIDNLHTKAFDQPIYLVLMNQSYCNGIGNYLRAEIIYRANIHPNTSAREAFKKYPVLFDLCRDIPLQAYALGGGQLKDWKSPFGVDSTDFGNFIQCYGNPNMNRIKDKNGRTFWYNPIWEL